MPKETNTIKYKYIIDCLNKQRYNNKNSIIFISSHGDRVAKKHSEVFTDIISTASRVKCLIGKSDQGCAILGNLSYEWFLIDIACLILGIKTFALPEDATKNEINSYLNDIKPSILFLDARSIWSDVKYKSIIWFNDISNGNMFLNDIIVNPEYADSSIDSDLNSTEHIELSYTVAFTSGTQGSKKQLSIPLPDLERDHRYVHFTHPPRQDFLSLKTPSPKFLIWMSYSHYVQRWMSLVAFTGGFDCVLSSPLQALSHLKEERPNILVSAPILYRLICRDIIEERNKFSIIQNFAHKIYLSLGLNRKPCKNLVRLFFDRLFFSNINDICGTAPVRFVWSGARIEQKVLSVLDEFGVQVYGSYALSELGAVAIDHKHTFKIGSSGIPHRKIRISADGEILIRFDENARDATRLTIDEEGYIHSGDYGYVDNDGHLFVYGRVDDILVLTNGKKIRLSPIEQKLAECAEVEEVLITSRDGMTLTAAVVPSNQDADATKIARAIRNLNSQLRAYERIAFFCVSPPFRSIENAVTRSQKIVRHVILEKLNNQEQFSVNAVAGSP